MHAFQDIQYNCILEGMTSVSALIHGHENGTNNRPIYAILIDQAKKRNKYREIGFLKYHASLLGFQILFTDQDVIDTLAQGNTHGGIIALCGDRTYKDTLDVESNGFWVYTEGIEDPFNLGFALRSLYAAGVDGVLLSPKNRMCVPGIVAKSSAGTSELMDIRVSEPEAAIRLFKQKGYQIVCAGIRDSQSIYDADLQKPVLLIVGGEKRGISRAVLDMADQIVRIDYGRAFNGSLSAASAATVIAFEVHRQNSVKKS